MAKDYIKIYNARDAKGLKDDREKYRSLQEAGLFPKSFDFPTVLQFELTHHCNVYCKHCYNNSGQNDKVDAMTPETWIEFSKYLVSHGGIFECILSGGEPLLLGEKLFDIMDILHDDGTNFLLITNGFLLNEEKVKRLSKYRYHWLQVSIDGSTPEFHDSFRQRRGSWQHAVDGAFMVSAAGIPLTIAHCVSPGNIDKIDDMCALAYSLGASSLLLGDINLSGRTAINRDLMLNTEQKNYLLQKYEENLVKYAGKMSIVRNASVKSSVLRYTVSPNYGMIIRPNGDCRLDCMAPFTIGNVLEEDFYTIWNTKGVCCWQDPRVQEYINSFLTDDSSTMVTNYYDKDIKI